MKNILKRFFYVVIFAMCMTAIMWLGIRLLGEYHVSGVVIDKAHNVTTDAYYLFIRTDDGDRRCEVDRYLFFTAKIGEEIDLGEKGR